MCIMQSSILKLSWCVQCRVENVFFCKKLEKIEFGWDVFVAILNGYYRRRYDRPNHFWHGDKPNSKWPVWHYIKRIMSDSVNNWFFPLLRALESSPTLSLTDSLSVCVHTEILDFGYPQNSETGALKTFITQQGIKGQVSETRAVSNCYSHEGFKVTLCWNRFRGVY